MGPCPDGAAPSDDICDGKDNDCDGKTDEGLTRPCGPMAQGACKPGIETCTAGAWGACTGAVEPKAEVCDAASVDENCDGAHNEGCTCVEGTMQSCGKNTGLCTAGVQMCAGGNWSSTCVGAVDPKMAEVCDQAMVDENCDGQKNEGCDCWNGQSQDCVSGALGPCKPGKQTCNAGKWSVCTSTLKPSAELCDSVDNNCDGQADNSVTDCKATEHCESGVCKCTPQCTGKTCGPDGCGGNCAPNTCQTGYTCQDGNCKCVPQCTGKICGPDGCGGNCAPNTCSSTQSCTNGQCVSNCGNRVVDPGEMCDDGVNSEAGACPHCQKAFCGDSFIQAGVEECEQNAPGWGRDYCTTNCIRTIYRKCPTGMASECTAEGANTNCSAWVSGTDTSTYVCGPYCDASKPCPAVGGYDTYCSLAFCALVCKDGTCPTNMRCARNVPVLQLQPDNTTVTFMRDVCVGS
jgi:hypothetical protein